MAESKITFKNNKGFWIHESFMQLAYYYIYEELIKSQYNLLNKDQLLYQIKFHIDGYSAGSMSLGWYKFIKSESEKQIMIQALQNVIIYLQTQGTYLSVVKLKEIPTDDEDFKIIFTKPFPILELIKIYNALIQMLKGIWESNNYDMKINW